MTKLRPEMLTAAQLSIRSGVALSTILRWAESGKVRSDVIIRSKARKLTLVNIYSFLNCVNRHYRFRKIKTRAGKWWIESELSNPVDRSPMAIRLKQLRLNQKKDNNIQKLNRIKDING